MKSATAYTQAPSRPHIPYPNAATRREIMNKFLDNMLVAAMVFAAVTAFLFFLTLA